MLRKGGLFATAIVALILLQGLGRTSGKDVEGFQGGDLTKLEQERICFNFTDGNPEKKEFYSPNYPNNYPNNTKCELQLKAPHGHVIQLDFREAFHLEDSPSCEYDWLEVRNGPQGFSPLVARLCGQQWPKDLPIVSADRYLWLKFYSDDSIEYEGFKAVYQFVPVVRTGRHWMPLECRRYLLPAVQLAALNPLYFERPHAEDCSFLRGGAGGLISPEEDVSKFQLNYSTVWKQPLDCTWVIRVEQGWKMYVTFQRYELKRPNDCDSNFIAVYEGALSDERRLAQFCGTATEPQKSDGSLVYVRYYARPDALGGKFEIVYTAFREADRCVPGEFSCDDGTCIDYSLKCNKMFNCKYRYDEDPALCTPAMTASRMLTSEHMITILCVFFALVAAMCASIVVTCRNKIRDRREKKREYKARRSKECSVEVLGLEAALAAQAAEIGAARGRKPGWDVDDGNCYVPEVDLSIFEKSPNGLGHIVDPMCREHGDMQRSVSPPLPPPPPPPHLRRSRDNPPPCQRHCPLADDDPPSFDSTRSAPDVIVHR